MIQEALVPAVEGEFEIKEFQKKPIRRICHKNERWFSVIDIVWALVDTDRAAGYWADLRKKIEKEWWNQVLDKIEKLEMQAKDWKFYATDGIRIEDIFRVIQSIPSKSAEPFKKWLAKVWFERLQEIQNPDLAVQRAITLYKAKWYDDAWIDARLRNINARRSLTDEWDKRGVQADRYGVLTDAIHIETFGIKTVDHKAMKGLKSQSLRDNMTPMELTLNTLAEQTAREITINKEAQTYHQVRSAAVEWWSIAGTARRSIEQATWKPVVSDTNYLTDRQRQNNEALDEPWMDKLASLLGEIQSD